jgi:sulfate/thiosulfate transport system ATP-binding protein
MSIVLEHLTKRYEGYPVVNNLSLQVSNGEFFVLLGPSGSGKSTVLRMIAGLIAVDHGRVVLHGRDVTYLLPQQRDTGFVFQHYALFRHMSVADNVEFALRIRKIPTRDRRKRRDELLELVGLSGLGGRMPHQLSGGQQQRVALARALAHQPAVLLLDEPFGALDAKIRVELRQTLKAVQRELGMTAIFVTHDQEEAFELADRLGVMNAGRLLEVGPPDELYQRPQTEFVATFLGTANLLIGELANDGVQLGERHFPLNTEAVRQSGAQRVQVLFRPEDILVAPADGRVPAAPLGRGIVERTTFVGSFERLRLRLPALPRVQPIAPAPPFGDDGILIEAVRSQDQARQLPLKTGDPAWIGVQRIHALTHPGMRLLLVGDSSPAGQAVFELGGQIARLAHARTTLLSVGESSSAGRDQLQAIVERLSPDVPALDAIAASEPASVAITREAERQPIDLLVLSAQGRESHDLIEQQLRVGEHHLLLVGDQTATPARMLICVASGEPGKDDVFFAGRLARHLGAAITLLSVVPQTGDRERAERFLTAGQRTLERMGVPASTVVRSGVVRDEIIDEMRSGQHDLLVLGAPLSSEGRSALAGVVGQIVTQATNYPVLIVRSRYAAGSRPWIGANGRVDLGEEVIR